MEHKSNTQDFGPPPQHGSVWPRIWRGIKLRCPRCGHGKLFRSYLKPVERCSHCNQAWAHVRAELAPAWAAMTLAAHVTVLIWHFFFWKTQMPSLQLTAILCAIATLICLVSLPAMKGLFMAILWSKGTTDS